MRRPALALAAALVAAAAVPALAAGPKASLGFGPNTYAYSASYGEPAVAVSPADGSLFVSTPGDGGAVLAKSTDDGGTWTKLPTVVPPGDSPGSATSGGDSEVAVAKDGTVFVGDLDLDGITVSRSTDGGRTFPQQVFVTGTSDREWLAVDGPHGEDVYLVWHEIVTGTMLAAVSHDRGATFSAPTTIYSNPETLVQSAHNGTSIGQVSTDGKGGVFVTYGTTRLTTTDTTYGTPPISTVHASVSLDRGATWKDVTVNPGADDANYGNFWMASAVDAGGTVYAVYSGYAHEGQPMHVWLQASHDRGATWTTPYAVDPGVGKAEGQDLFGWVAGGGPGVAVVAWYHTDAKDKDADGIDWSVPVAQVRGLGTTHVQQVTGLANDHPSVHHGPICTLGTFCGVLPGSSSDRSLLDFFKVTVDPTGRAAVVWSDNDRPGAVKT
ncbi:MAG: hypothetical protein JWN17_2543, partial [Frankiales bacterium]|nr:hypothetical protein [Frankiales bacterium]